ncbi:neuronal acetylcholine receptor subunit alpha-10-like [Ptychodera flava]|uniref:neuronal acetylcholine receptor subunit alpha-10-like n=1 Tax=Ptychodera flava TaxID=63121 RepID=UPI00396A5A66
MSRLHSLRDGCPCTAAVVVLLCVITEILVAEGSSVNLVPDLLSNYPSNTRPVYNVSTVTNVTHRLLPIQILDVDEKNQILTLKAWLRMVWQDEFLTWNASQYDDVTSVVIPVSEIWQPDITSYESVKKEFVRHLDTDAHVTNDGIVNAPQPVIYETTCTIDATYFPFDEQRCSLKFGSWSYDGGMIDLYLDETTGSTEAYVSNGEWDLVGFPSQRNSILYSCCPNPYVDVTYTLHIRRRSLFYIYNIVLPAVLLFILVLVGFYLPSDCGERMTLFVTSMLALMVFLTLASDFMPPTSESTPYIQSYLITTIALVAVSSLLTAFTLDMHFQPARCPEMPRWLRIFAFRYLAVLVCMRSQRSNRKVDSNGEVIVNKSALSLQALGQEANADSSQPYNGDVPEKLFTRVNRPKTAADDTNESEVHERRVREWQAAAKIFDRFFLVTYFIIFLILSIGILSYLHTKAH